MVDDACTDGESGIFPGRRTVLKWPKHHSNTAALVVVGMQVQSVCVSGRWVEAMCDSISSLCLVRECRELEEMHVWFSLHCQVAEGRIDVGKELGDQESGLCTATGQIWSESPPYCTSGEASWMGKSLGCSLRL